MAKPADNAKVKSKKKKKKSPQRALSDYFGVRISLTILLIVVISFICIFFYFHKLAADNKAANKRLTKSVSSVILNACHSGVATGSFKDLDFIVTQLTKSQILSYAHISKENGTVVFSTDKNANAAVKNSGFAEFVDNKDPRCNLKLGFINLLGEDEFEHLGMLIVFAVIFFFIGGIASWFIAVGIKELFHDLIVGVNEFAKGNLNYRLKRTKYKEIDELVIAYNSMAIQLCDLYASLELKVAQRTSELSKSNMQLKEAQGMMVHSEKMRSLGELVAGIAHEINNPINFIHGNLMHLEGYIQDLLELVEKYKNIEALIPPEKIEDINKFKEDIDMEFLGTDIKALIESCKEGTERTKNIVLDLKNFSRLDAMVLSEFDISKELDMTLNILHNKFKNRKVQIVKNYDPETPVIDAYGGQLNQVFMNIIDNAVYAIKDEGTVTITVVPKRAFGKVVIEFTDTGVGIPQDKLRKVFEPFFTTKPTGEGTGLGMSIAYKVVTSHGGTMDVRSQVGKGTTIHIELPINQEGKKDDGQQT